MKTIESKLTSCIAIPAILLVAGLTGNAHAITKSWINSKGDPAKVAYKIGCTATANAITASASASGNAYADVAMLGSSYKRIAYANVTTSATKTSLAGSGTIQFLGRTI